MPSRKIPKNYSNITGKIASEKATRMLSYESKLERDFYFLLEFDKSIEQIYDQPITIEYEFKGKQRKYTPDVLLHCDTYPHYILGEMKYHDELFAKFKELRPKFEAAIEYCKQNEDMQFKLFTNRCPQIISEVHRNNISFLLSYKDIDLEYEQLIRENYQDSDTLEGLLEKITTDKFEQMEIIPTLWAMLRFHAFEVDLFSPLSRKTVLQNIRECIFPKKIKETE